MSQLVSRSSSLLFVGSLLLSCGGDSFESIQGASGAAGAGGGSAGAGGGSAGAGGGSAGAGGGSAGAGGSAGGSDGGVSGNAGGAHDGGKEASTLCAPGTGDCDGHAANGCETTLADAPESCGACGHSCLGGACAAGRCQPAPLWIPANGDQVGRALFPDGAWVYLALGVSSGTVGRVSKAGGEPQWFATGLGSPDAVVAEADVAYWLDSTYHQLNKASSSSGDVFVASVGTTGRALAIAGGLIYYADLSSKQLVSVKPDGTGSTVLAAAEATSIAVAPDARLFFSTKTAIFVRGPMGAQAIASGYSDVREVRVDAGHVCWSDYGNGKLWAMAQTEKVPSLVGSVKALNIALDAQHIYYADRDLGVIGRVPLAGGPPEALAAEQPLPADIAVDDKAIYWLNELGGAVFKLAK